uniref:BLOC-1-related complex subunit 5 n=1 Tax=Parastrongyloides trichosuri TaxID=131310 RepID=A0A0N5A5U4_PARTI
MHRDRRGYRRRQDQRPDRSSRPAAPAHGGDGGRQAGRQPLSRARTLPLAHPRTGQAGNRAYPPDPRAHGPRQLPVGRRPGIRRALPHPAGSQRDHGRRAQDLPAPGPARTLPGAGSPGDRGREPSAPDRAVRHPARLAQAGARHRCGRGRPGAGCRSRRQLHQHPRHRLHVHDRRLPAGTVLRPCRHPRGRCPCRLARTGGRCAGGHARCAGRTGQRGPGMAGPGHRAPGVRGGRRSVRSLHDRSSGKCQRLRGGCAARQVHGRHLCTGAHSPGGPWHHCRQAATGVIRLPVPGGWHGSPRDRACAPVAGADRPAGWFDQAPVDAGGLRRQQPAQGAGQRTRPVAKNPEPYRRRQHVAGPGTPAQPGRPPGPAEGRPVHLQRARAAGGHGREQQARQVAARPGRQAPAVAGHGRADCRRQVPRRVRRTPQRPAQRAVQAGRPDHPVHRRAAHHGGCRAGLCADPAKDRAVPSGAGNRPPQGRPEPHGRAAVWGDPGPGAQPADGRPAWQGRKPVAAQQGDRGRDRRGGVEVDRYPGIQDARRRARKAAEDGKPAAPARDRPGRGRGGRGQRGASGGVRASGSRPDRRYHPDPAVASAQPSGRTRAEPGAEPRGPRQADRGRLRPGVWRTAAETGDPALDREPAGATDSVGSVHARQQHHRQAGGRRDRLCLSFRRCVECKLRVDKGFEDCRIARLRDMNAAMHKVEEFEAVAIQFSKLQQVVLEIDSSAIAQSVEQMTVNHWVPGSSPGRGAKFQTGV